MWKGDLHISRHLQPLFQGESSEMRYLEKKYDGLLPSRRNSRVKLTHEVIEQLLEINRKHRHSVCERLRVRKNSRQSYNVGLKRCTTCEVYFDTDEIKCPCCGKMLRSNARAKTGTSKNQPSNDTRTRVG